MSFEQQKKKGTRALIGAGLVILVALFFLGLAGEMKDSWEYKWDDDVQNNVTMLSVLGWSAMICGVVDMIYGIVLITVKDNTTFSPPSNIGGGSVGSNLTTCRDCGGAVSRMAETCPHCGRSKPGQRNVPET